MTNAHTKIEFDRFLLQLKETNATLDFFVDFDKVTDNVRQIEFNLNQLNYLLGKSDMNEAIRFVWQQNPNAFTVLDIIIAVRRKDKKKVITASGKVQLLESYFGSVDDVILFIQQTGLQELFQSRKIKNLVDYVLGVEVGLDTNARKNRSGKLMAKQVAAILDSQNIPYRCEVASTEFPRLEILGKDKKRFDFVIKTRLKTYLIEVNFYSGGGSKLNEVARSYSDIGYKINSVPGYEFVWITDGQGWFSAKNKLEEAYYILPNVFNLSNLSVFIDKIKAEINIESGTIF